MTLPRYFVPHSATPPEPLQVDPDALVHAVDAFRLRAAHGEQEWCVCTDLTGDVVALPAGEDIPLPPSVRAQLTHHELASGHLPRRLSGQEFFLFSVQLVEHPAEAQGVNDPVYLYGTLAGPWPDGPPQRLRGQLTVTRGDVLAGLVRGAPEALHYPQDPETRGAPLAYHALLPGARPEQLAEGRGLVLAYPAVAVDLQTHNAANGPMVATILHAVLAQLHEDARAHGGPQALAQLELPVPSRFMAVAELESRGYEVKGDVATLHRNHPGLLNRLHEWLTAETLRVPREASPSEFLELAHKALGALPGWPSDTERVLRSLVHTGHATPTGGLPALPSLPAAPRVLPPRAPAPPADRGDWMQDFLDAHSRPGGSRAKLSRVRAPSPPASPPAAPSSPDWMNDFGPSSKPPSSKPPSSKSPTAEPSKKPDWMSDFED